jgi:hypothetical protein
MSDSKEDSKLYETNDTIMLSRQLEDVANRSAERTANLHNQDMQMLWKIIRMQSTYIEEMRKQHEYALRFVGFATLVSLTLVLWKLL